MGGVLIGSVAGPKHQGLVGEEGWWGEMLGVGRVRTAVGAVREVGYRCRAGSGRKTNGWPFKRVGSGSENLGWPGLRAKKASWRAFMAV